MTSKPETAAKEKTIAGCDAKTFAEYARRTQRDGQADVVDQPLVSEEMHNHLVRCFKALGSACKVNLGNGPIVRGTTQIQCAGVFFGEGISFTIEGDGVVVRFGGTHFAHFLPLRGSCFPTSAEFKAMWKSAEDDRAEARRAEFNGVSEELHAHFVRCIRAVEHAINMRFGLSIRRGTTMVSCNNALRSGGVCFVVDVENDTIRIKFEAAPNYSYAIALGEPFPTYDELKNVWASAFEEAERFAAEHAQRQFPSSPVHTPLERHPATYSTDLAGLVARHRAMPQGHCWVDIDKLDEATGSFPGLGGSSNMLRDEHALFRKIKERGVGRYKVRLYDYITDAYGQGVMDILDIVEVTISEDAPEAPKRTFSKVAELKVKHEDRDEEDEREQERERKADIAFSEYEKRKHALTKPLSVEYVQTILDEMLEERGFAKGRLVVDQYPHLKTHLYLYDYGRCALGSFGLQPLDHLKFADTVIEWCVHKEKQRRDAFRDVFEAFKEAHPAEQFISSSHAAPARRDGLTPVVVFDLFHEAEDAAERHRTDPALEVPLDCPRGDDCRESYGRWSRRKIAEIKERLTVDARHTLREWPTSEGVPMKIEVTEPTGKGIFIARWVKG